MTSGFSRWEVLPAAASVIILALAALAVFGVQRVGFRRRVSRVVGRIPWCGPRLAHVLAGIYRRHLVEQLRSVVGDRRALLLAVSWASANWAFDALALWASLRAYGSSVGLEALAVVFGMQALAAWLPITPSGLGISEALIIPALIAFGSHRSAVVLGILTWRVLAYWLPIPLGALAFGSLRVFHRPATEPATPTSPRSQFVLPAARTETSPVAENFSLDAGSAPIPVPVPVPVPGAETGPAARV